MKTEYMVEYLNLAKTLSFTKTAAELYTSQPTLSKHIQALEDEIGAPLFNRSTHEISLTEEGKVVCEYFEKILGDCDEMLREVGLVSQGIAGNLNVGYMGNSGMEFLDPGVDAFYAKYPNIELKLTPMHPSKIIESLQDDEIDVGLLFETSHLPQREFEFKQLGLYEWKVVLSDKNPLANKSEISLEDLGDQPMVEAKSDEAFSELRSKFMEENGFEPAETVYCNESNFMAVIIRTKGGYYIGTDSLQRKDLVAVPLHTESPGVPIGLAYKRENPNQSISHFISCF